MKTVAAFEIKNVQLLDPQGATQGQRVAGSRTITIRCEDDDVRNLFQRLCQDIDALGEITVVIAHEDFYFFLDGRARFDIRRLGVGQTDRAHYTQCSAPTIASKTLT